MSIGERLKEERGRLGFNQTDFAALAQTTKKSQIEYEKGASYPNAAYLASVATAGADVRYIVTGDRGAALPLRSDEQLLLDRYRQSPPSLKDAALRVLLGAETPPAAAPRYTVTQKFRGNVDVGQQATGDIINKSKGDKKR